MGIRRFKRQPGARMNERLQELLERVQRQLEQPVHNWTLITELANEAIALTDDDTDPTVIAQFHGILGASLAEAADADDGDWTEETVQRVLQAYGKAIELFSPAQYPAQWLQTLRNIGITYFTAALNGLGDVPSRVAKAIEVYEDVLSAASPTLDPELRSMWQQEFDSVRELSIKMWEDALSQFHRERYPQEWALAQLALGALYRERRAGDGAENLERSVTSLDRALEVLSFEATPGEWLRAHAHRGQAYLFRHEGDKSENLARALKSLRITAQHLKKEDDPPLWVVVMAQIGQVCLQRNEIDAAIKALEQAFTIDQTFWRPEVWAENQLLLAGMRMGMTIDENTTIRTVRTPPQPWSHDPINDPFDMAGTLSRQAEILAKNVDMRRVIEDHVVTLSKDSAPVEIDPEWHVPSMLMESVVILQRHFEKGMTSGALWLRTGAEREALERGREQLYGMTLDHVRERREAAVRTDALFERVARGEESYALALHEFHMRTRRFQGGAGLTFGRWGESLFMADMAQRIEPMALVWIANPVDAGSPDPREGYRVESASDWQADVRKLIAAASFIVMDNHLIDNDPMPEGLSYEIGALRELGRLDDTLFRDPRTASELLGISVRKFSDDQLDVMRRRAKPRSIDRSELPAAACGWIEGARRQNYESRLLALMPWIETLPTPRSAVAADLILDALAYVISVAVLLQNGEVLPSLFQMAANTVAIYAEDDLSDAQQLARAYAEVAEALRTGAVQLF